MIFSKNDADFQDYFFLVNKVHNEKLAGYLEESDRKPLTKNHIFINQKVQGIAKMYRLPILLEGYANVSI